MEQPSPSLLKRIKNAIKSVVNGGQDKTKGSHEGVDARAVDPALALASAPPSTCPPLKDIQTEHQNAGEQDLKPREPRRASLRARKVSFHVDGREKSILGIRTPSILNQARVPSNASLQATGQGEHLTDSASQGPSDRCQSPVSDSPIGVGDPNASTPTAADADSSRWHDFMLDAQGVAGAAEHPDAQHTSTWVHDPAVDPCQEVQALVSMCAEMQSLQAGEGAVQTVHATSVSSALAPTNAAVIVAFLITPWLDHVRGLHQEDDAQQNGSQAGRRSEERVPSRTVSTLAQRALRRSYTTSVSGAATSVDTCVIGARTTGESGYSRRSHTGFVDGVPEDEVHDGSAEGLGRPAVSNPVAARGSVVSDQHLSGQNSAYQRSSLDNGVTNRTPSSTAKFFQLLAESTRHLRVQNRLSPVDRRGRATGLQRKHSKSHSDLHNMESKAADSEDDDSRLGEDLELLKGLLEGRGTKADAQQDRSVFSDFSRGALATQLGPPSYNPQQDFMYRRAMVRTRSRGGIVDGPTGEVAGGGRQTDDEGSPQGEGQAGQGSSGRVWSRGVPGAGSGRLGGRHGGPLAGGSGRLHSLVSRAASSPDLQQDLRAWVSHTAPTNLVTGPSVGAPGPVVTHTSQHSLPHQQSSTTLATSRLSSAGPKSSTGSYLPQSKLSIATSTRPSEGYPTPPPVHLSAAFASQSNAPLPTVQEGGQSGVYTGLAQELTSEMSTGGRAPWLVHETTEDDSPVTQASGGAQRPRLPMESGVSFLCPRHPALVASGVVEGGVVDTAAHAHSMDTCRSAYGSLQPVSFNRHASALFHMRSLTACTGFLDVHVASNPSLMLVLEELVRAAHQGRAETLTHYLPVIQRSKSTTSLTTSTQGPAGEQPHRSSTPDPHGSGSLPSHSGTTGNSNTNATWMWIQVQFTVVNLVLSDNSIDTALFMYLRPATLAVPHGPAMPLARGIGSQSGVGRGLCMPQMSELRALPSNLSHAGSSTGNDNNSALSSPLRAATPPALPPVPEGQITALAAPDAQQDVSTAQHQETQGPVQVSLPMYPSMPVSKGLAAALSAQLSHLTAAMAHVPCIVTVMGVPNGRVLWQNGRSVEFCGLIYNRPRQLTYSSLDHPQHTLRRLFALDTPSLEKLISAVKQGQPWSGLVRMPVAVDLNEETDTTDNTVLQSRLSVWRRERRMSRRYSQSANPDLASPATSVKSSTSSWLTSHLNMGGPGSMAQLTSEASQWASELLVTLNSSKIATHPPFQASFIARNKDAPSFSRHSTLDDKRMLMHLETCTSSSPSRNGTAEQPTVASPPSTNAASGSQPGYATGPGKRGKKPKSVAFNTHCDVAPAVATMAIQGVGASHTEDAPASRSLPSAHGPYGAHAAVSSDGSHVGPATAPVTPSTAAGGATLATEQSLGMRSSVGEQDHVPELPIMPGSRKSFGRHLVSGSVYSSLLYGNAPADPTTPPTNGTTNITTNDNNTQDMVLSGGLLGFDGPGSEQVDEFVSYLQGSDNGGGQQQRHASVRRSYDIPRTHRPSPKRSETVGVETGLATRASYQNRGSCFSANGVIEPRASEYAQFASSPGTADDSKNRSQPLPRLMPTPRTTSLARRERVLHSTAARATHTSSHIESLESGLQGTARALRLAMHARGGAGSAGQSGNGGAGSAPVRRSMDVSSYRTNWSPVKETLQRSGTMQASQLTKPSSLLDPASCPEQPFLGQMSSPRPRTVPGSDPALSQAMSQTVVMCLDGLDENSGPCVRTSLVSFHVPSHQPVGGAGLPAQEPGSHSESEGVGTRVSEQQAGGIAQKSSVANSDIMLAPSMFAPTNAATAAQETVDLEEDMYQWHEVEAHCLKGPAGEMLLLTHHDVTRYVNAELEVKRVLDVEHKLLEEIFPRHVLEAMASKAAAGAAAAAAATAHPGTRRQTSTNMVGVTSLNPESEDPPLERTSLTFKQMVARRKSLDRKTAGMATVGTEGVARHHECVSILFADIASFTSMSNELAPSRVMTFLNDLFTQFDELVEEHGIYKVETIGDCYMCAAGLLHKDADGVNTISTQSDPDHANKMLAFAKDMLLAAASTPMPTPDGRPVQLRVGIHSGPCMSGVVGRKMPRFCLFGDTINTSSRCESTGRPGHIHISADTWRCLREAERRDPAWQATGGVQAKGKGVLETYLWTPPADWYQY